MNTDNVVEFLRLLSLDVTLGAAAQHAASQADAPQALARMACRAARKTGPVLLATAWAFRNTTMPNPRATTPPSGNWCRTLPRAAAFRPSPSPG